MKSANNEYLFIEAIKEGYFRIDSEGRIWRTAIRCREKQFKIPERKMKYKNKQGYICLCLWKNKKNYNYFAHRLVWIYFNGLIPDELEMNHINGIKHDNRPENLELVTKSENEKHAYRTGLKNGLRGEKNGRAKVTENDVREIRRRYSRGETQASITKGFNVGKSMINYIVNRKQWVHI